MMLLQHRSLARLHAIFHSMLIGRNHGQAFSQQQALAMSCRSQEKRLKRYRTATCGGLSGFKNCYHLRPAGLSVKNTNAKTGKLFPQKMARLPPPSSKRLTYRSLAMATNGFESHVHMNSILHPPCSSVFPLYRQEKQGTKK